MSDIGEKIRKARKEASLTQWGLSSACGGIGRKITGTTIYHYEKGQTSPTVESLEAIAKATGTKLIIAFHKNPITT